LDAKGLVAFWHAGLLARKVLQGQTHGFRHDAQLFRFIAQTEPLTGIECYLWGVYEESLKRSYHFDAGKLRRKPGCDQMPVSADQIRYELAHLQRKLKERDAVQYRKIQLAKKPLAFPHFKVVPGDIESWEKVA
jgi:hypothetical protein